MRVLVGSIQQETNSFSPVKPTIEDFDYLEGEEMLNQIAVTSFFQKENVELVPTIYANAVPSGRLSRKEYEKLCERLLERIPDEPVLDGIWLYCHGAMDVEEIGSGELYLLQKIREKVGFNIPLTVALDFHANIRPELTEYANVICGYRTAPHRDMKETQIRAAQHLVTCMRKKILPKPTLVHIPMILAGDMVLTDLQPMRAVMDMSLSAENDPEILDASVFNGQNWVDVAHAGASVVVTAMHDTSLSQQYANDIAAKYWEIRKDFAFLGDACEPAEAVERMMKYQGEEPVFLTDSGDNTTAGAAGDSTELLEVLLEKGAVRTAFVGLTDKPAVEKLYMMEPGQTTKLSIGGTLSKTSTAISVEAHLLRKERILGWDGFDAGRAAVIRINNVDVVVTENRSSVISPEILKSVGIDMLQYHCIVVKLGYLYPALGKVAPHHIIAFTNGASSVKVEKLPFEHISHPMYPFDTELQEK